MSFVVTAKERPILFTGERVRAILDGTQTETRRVVKLPKHARSIVQIARAPEPHSDEFHGTYWEAGSLMYKVFDCPYGAPGDRLWVRETWQSVYCWEDGHVEWPRTIPRDRGRWHVAYAADDHPTHVEDRGWSWRPSIHMPRWASRITLEVTGVRVERVQEITEEGARAEGCIPDPCDHRGSVLPNACENCMNTGDKWPARQQFEALWDINAKRGFGWDANPFVWVVAFRRIEP